MYQRLPKVKFLHEDFIRDPEGVIESWSKSKLKGLDRFIRVAKHRGRSFTLTTAELSDIWGCSPASACRWKKEWVELGLITVTPCFRDMENGLRLQTANIYELSPYFYTEEAEFTLSCLFPSLKLVSLALLTVVGSLSAQGSIDNEHYERGRLKERVIRTLLFNKKISPECGGLAMTSEARSKELDLEAFVPSWVNGIKILHLSRAGKVRLSCYERKAIEYAVEKLALTTSYIANPFAYFVALCEVATRNFDLNKNIDYLNTLKKTYHVSNTDPMLLSRRIIRPVNKPGSKTGSTVTRKTPQRDKIKPSSTETATGDAQRPSTPSWHNRNRTTRSYPNQRRQPFADKHSSTGSLSRAESPMVRNANKSKIPHPYKLWEPSKTVSKELTAAERDAPNEFLDMFGIPDHIKQNDAKEAEATAQLKESE